MTDNAMRELESKLQGVRVEASADLDRRVTELARSLDGAVARRRWFRVAASVAVAALLCGLAFLLSEVLVPSAHAQLRRALENSKAAEWVHFRMNTDEGEAEHWLSLRPVRIIRKVGEAVEYTDTALGQKWVYDPNRREIEIQDLPKDQHALSVAGSFFDYYMDALEKARDHDGVQFSRKEAVENGRKMLVFEFNFQSQATMGKCIVDVALKRIVRCEGQQADQPPVRITFDYPEEGPADIYAVGVPRDATIANNATGWNITKIANCVTAARNRFPKGYFAVVIQSREGICTRAHAVHKKNGDFRVEHFITDRIPVPEDTADFEAWIGKHGRISRICFYPGDRSRNATMVSLDESGKLQRKSIGNTGASMESVESMPHNGTAILHKSSHAEQEVLEQEEGDQGPLIVARTTYQGRIIHGHFWEPQRITVHYNPARDWIAERAHSLSDVEAPWQKDTALCSERCGPGRRKGAESFDTVLEYARTPGGAWYARRRSDKTIFRNWLADGTVKASESEYVTSVYLDTERSFADSLFDPKRVDCVERFDARHAKALAALRAVQATVDAETTWPEKPEDVAREYLDAYARGDIAALRRLNPGLAAKPDEECRAGRGGEYVMGFCTRTGPDARIPYAPTEAGLEDPRQRSFLHLRSTRKGRYYVDGGPY